MRECENQVPFVVPSVHATIPLSCHNHTKWLSPLIVTFHIPKLAHFSLVVEPSLLLHSPLFSPLHPAHGFDFYGITFPRRLTSLSLLSQFLSASPVVVTMNPFINRDIVVISREDVIFSLAVDMVTVNTLLRYITSSYFQHNSSKTIWITDIKLSQLSSALEISLHLINSSDDNAAQAIPLPVISIGKSIIKNRQNTVYSGENTIFWSSTVSTEKHDCNGAQESSIEPFIRLTQLERIVYFVQSYHDSETLISHWLSRHHYTDYNLHMI